MKKNIINIPNYIYGEKRFSEPSLVKTVRDIYGNTRLKVNYANHWTLEAAKDNASEIQKNLEIIPTKKIISLLNKAMDHYFNDEYKYELISSLTGSPISFVKEGIEFVKDWCRNIERYLEKALPHSEELEEGGGINYTNTSPVVAILPGNSEQESLYVLAQALLSRNATILRPSERGAGCLTAMEFVDALNKAIDESGDKSLNILKRAVSVIHTNPSNYLDSLAVSGWNYLFFGSDETIKNIESRVRKNCPPGEGPRKVIGYGTGLSITVVLSDCNLNESVHKIMDSITINSGNECTSTDIIYVDKNIHKQFLEELIKESKNYLSGDPLDFNLKGLPANENVDFIMGELIKRGKSQFLRISLNNEKKVLHCSIIPLSNHDSTLEYPGPIVSIRPFSGVTELFRLIQKDLKDNEKNKNLITSIFTGSENKFKEILPFLQTYMVKLNKGTHEFNKLLPHQGIYLIRELVDHVYIDR